MTIETLVLTAPLVGWCMPLTEVPDPVFAQGMVGDGVAIDPTNNILYAPCAGEIVPMQGAMHALTIHTNAGADLLLHLGIDTIQLGGKGFEFLVGPGDLVTAGQAMLRFDLDLIARRARSAVTPILLASEGIIRRRSQNCAVEIGDFLMEIEVATSSTKVPHAPTNVQVCRKFSVFFDHGLHARPSAQIAATLRPFKAEVVIMSRGRQGNARSAVSIMSLGIMCGEMIEIKASGFDAMQALVALESILSAEITSPTAVASPMVVAQKSAGSACQIKAVIASGGIGIGQATSMTRQEIVVSELGSGMELELAAFQAAAAKVKSHIESMVANAVSENRAILAAHVELIQDPELVRQTTDFISQGKSAGYAWRQTTREMIAALNALGDARMMERAGDLRDIEAQLLSVLAGKSLNVSFDLPDHAILLADELLPSQLISLDRARIAGICMARGGATSHVAIIASSMGIPVLVAAGAGVLDIENGVTLLLDAERGVLIIDPPPEVRLNMEKMLAARNLQQVSDLATARLECKTIDHVNIAVFANIGKLAETISAVEHGAEGCGLLRTEFLFLERREPPTEKEQAQEYQAIATALGGRPLTIRTLDIGGDKPIPYLPLPREDNPALGLRGLRTSLWCPELMRTQLRAILSVRPLSQCRILLPMVTDIDDICAVRVLLDEIQLELALTEVPHLGIMIETPASALLADQLVAEVDFLSIGTNDLSQYTLAMDRGHSELAARLDALHPAVLRLIATAAKAGRNAGKEVAVCGGLGSDAAAIPILIGLGINEVSAVPASIPRIKRLIRSMDSNACRKLANEALEQPNAAAVRTLVERWYSTAVQTTTGE